MRKTTSPVVDAVAKTGKWIVLVFFLIITFFPLLWLVISSFKTDLELVSRPFNLPAVWQIQNYVRAFQLSDLHLLFLHSIIVSAVATALNIFVASMASYALSRFRFGLNNVILSVILAGVLIPIIALMVPYFQLISKLGIYDSLLALILTYAAINLPISVFLIHGFMGTVPKELEEAGLIDGCSFWQRYARIVFPLSRLGVVTAGTFVFLYAWNEFIYALLLTSSVRARTLQLGIRFFKSQFRAEYTAMYAALVVTIIPSIVVYILFHEKIIQGLSSGAVKG
jgi:raffinose/stachyose/melibiose transport system permease protein